MWLGAGCFSPEGRRIGRVCYPDHIDMRIISGWFVTPTVKYRDDIGRSTGVLFRTY